ncbi:FAD dependent oxidoreductase [Desulfitobacterium hafniense DP7]|uniref:FAD dependent oxidoreductase n=1 Tax=Desulfitobacterium hafniense DP7 TaxID=537010 RepID=G9XGS8_DESHA|nr:FAD-dependent oxidoreductase [Desulfitobacterium hafniense]EHL09113.1 FAD dependent oxidoreductase [Desulfitobacterium hafniense DP7]
MSEQEKFDAIVLGAGPAGSACAYTLAKAGKSVILIERGDSPGSKNVTGGRLYTYALNMLDPEIVKEAALERIVTQEDIMMLSGDKALIIKYQDPSFGNPEEYPHSCTVLRAKFDGWLAGKAEEMGAFLACGIKVDELIEENGKIVGVKAGEDEMYADVVIAADGVNSLIGQKAGLIEEKRTHLGVGVKEIIELPAKVIEERFNLEENEGAARVILGCTEGIHGGGFLYTNRESISLGCVFLPEEAAQKGKSVHELFQDFKMNPAIYNLLKEGKTVEYGAHLVCEAGYRGIPKKLYREGLLLIGEAAGFVINTGYSIRGIDLAIVSGIAAAKAVISSEKTADVGPVYLRELETTELIPTMKAVDGYFNILDTEWLYDKVPNLAVDIFGSLFTVTGKTPESIKKLAFGAIKNHDLTLWELAKFAIKGVRSL